MPVDARGNGPPGAHLPFMVVPEPDSSPEVPDKVIVIVKKPTIVLPSASLLAAIRSRALISTDSGAGSRNCWTTA